MNEQSPLLFPPRLAPYRNSDFFLSTPSAYYPSHPTRFYTPSPLNIPASGLAASATSTSFPPSEYYDVEDGEYRMLSVFRSLLLASAMTVSLVMLSGLMVEILVGTFGDERTYQ